jgi:hypothetical protein
MFPEKRLGLPPPIFPLIDCAKGNSQLVGELLLGKPQTLAQTFYQGGHVVHILLPCLVFNLIYYIK